jgi:O-methyltransferase
MFAFIFLISLFNALNILLLLVLLFIVFKYVETFWSYKINKPYAWEQAIKNKTVSKELKSLEFATRDKVRFYTLWFQIERLKKNKISGSFAELGVYKGVTANIMYEMDRNRTLHLFDTFEGFDEKDLLEENRKGGKYSKKEFADTSVQAVREYINGGDKIVFHKGYFPETAIGLEQEEFAFVSIDADLYKPTLEGLNFFYKRLIPEGVLLIHDYNHNWEGAKKAVDEFVKVIPECIFEVPDWQGSVLIIKNKLAQ